MTNQEIKDLGVSNLIAIDKMRKEADKARKIDREEMR